MGAAGGHDGDGDLLSKIIFPDQYPDPGKLKEGEKGIADLGVGGVEESRSQGIGPVWTMEDDQSSEDPFGLQWARTARWIEADPAQIGLEDSIDRKLIHRPLFPGGVLRRKFRKPLYEIEGAVPYVYMDNPLHVGEPVSDLAAMVEYMNMVHSMVNLLVEGDKPMAGYIKDQIVALLGARVDKDRPIVVVADRFYSDDGGAALVHTGDFGWDLLRGSGRPMEGVKNLLNALMRVGGRTRGERKYGEDFYERFDGVERYLWSLTLRALHEMVGDIPPQFWGQYPFFAKLGYATGFIPKESVESHGLKDLFKAQIAGDFIMEQGSRSLYLLGATGHRVAVTVEMIESYIALYLLSLLFGAENWQKHSALIPSGYRNAIGAALSRVYEREYPDDSLALDVLSHPTGHRMRSIFVGFERILNRALNIDAPQVKWPDYNTVRIVRELEMDRLLKQADGKR